MSNEIIASHMRKPVSELPARFREVFPYVCLNHVQSMVFDTVMTTNKPIVVSAPTGSGKTGVFELAIVKMIIDCELKCADLGPPKVIYLAPTKALCTERSQDWGKKFSNFNLQCLELTSDTTTTVNFKNLKKSSILLATPEKWDSITRSWSGNMAFVKSIRLLLVDEVHLVNDGARGATLEAVISRMKTIRSIIWSTEPDNLRFIGVSATVSNVRDIAEWFSTNESNAEVCSVDPSKRPVKLRTIVNGYLTSPNINEFSFDATLNHKLADVIKDHSNHKPTLIFCATRKSTVAAATTIMKEGKFDLSFSSDKRKLYLQLSSQLKDKVLQETVRFGIAFHHAGLCTGDRKLIEAGFLDGRVMILCCTSTLALGVNLPAHLVIIKNTSYFSEGQFKPYSESAIVQMIGRAGRPQFDTAATAVIMTKSYLRDSIEKMLSGKLIVDSQLHKHLTEHLNSEIVLKTITDDAIARKWIDATYLHVRLMKNPENYGLLKTSSAAAKESTIIEWCQDSIKLLIKHGMIERNQQGQLEATSAGKAMARHYIRLETMINLVNLKGSENMKELILIISSCNEVISDVQLRVEERSALNALNNPADESGKFRFPIGDKIDTKEKKAAALIQATFGNITITENSLFQESLRVIRNASRVMNCLKDITMINDSIGYNLLLNVLVLNQCFAAKLWENSVYVSKQLERIGAILSQNLAKNGLTTFESLRKANPRNIEIFCNRLPPFGSNVQQTCFGLPIYELDLKFREIPNQSGKIQMVANVSILNGQDMRNIQSIPRSHESILILGNIRDNKLLFKQTIVDLILLSQPDLTVCFGADLDKTDLPNVGDDIEAYILSGSFVGINMHKIVKYVESDITD